MTVLCQFSLGCIARNNCCSTRDFHKRAAAFHDEFFIARRCVWCWHLWNTFVNSTEKVFHYKEECINGQRGSKKVSEVSQVSKEPDIHPHPRLLTTLNIFMNWFCCIDEWQWMTWHITVKKRAQQSPMLVTVRCPLKSWNLQFGQNSEDRYSRALCCYMTMTIQAPLPTLLRHPKKFVPRCCTVGHIVPVFDHQTITSSGPCKKRHESEDSCVMKRQRQRCSPGSQLNRTNLDWRNMKACWPTNNVCWQQEDYLKNDLFAFPEGRLKLILQPERR